MLGFITEAAHWVRFSAHVVRCVSPHLLYKALRLWIIPALVSLDRWHKRRRQGELFPPFLFIALTNACNLRCVGCWVEGSQKYHLPPRVVENLIRAAKEKGNRFFILLGGEPFLYPHLWDLLKGHRDCYFQIITNGLFFDRQTVARCRRLGNITPLVSIDGLDKHNDLRRGQGVFAKLLDGLQELRRARLFFGIATTITSDNYSEVLSDAYVRWVMRNGATYLWYYVFRPVGRNPAHHLCLSREQLLGVRQRLLELRQRHPILIVDTYWDEVGRAVCPAAQGSGYHIGPRGSVEPCPPLSFACEKLSADGDPVQIINQSRFLRAFQQFVLERTRGCVILEYPHELAEFLRSQHAADYSGRDMVAELAASPRHCSHHLPGCEIPEQMWLYRLLKQKLFLGFGAYG